MTTPKDSMPWTNDGGQNARYKVRIWNITTYKGKRKTTYTVRWTVDGNQFPATFDTKKLAESFRAKLITAAREGLPFDSNSGLPASMAQEQNSRSWYKHACAFVDMKWPHVSARHRQGIAEALATVTPALVTTDHGMPETRPLRHALYSWSFNTTARTVEPTDQVKRADRWISANTVQVAAMTSPALIRRALDALAVTLDGKAAAFATISRKRAIFYSALQYAVELGLLPANPIDRVQWKAPRHTDAIDRRVVVNPGQARSLLSGVCEIDPSLEAFYACMYYAATRPAEALHLRESDCTLPDENHKNQWGELLLNGSTQHVGHAWSDTGDAKEDRALKHRADNDTRTVPACPELVSILRQHLKQFGTSPDGRLFVTRTARFGRPLAGPYNAPVSNNTYSRVWRKAREKALTPDQVSSPLAARPYDLRHAAVSLWLNAGVPATQVAEWAGHSVHVLLKVYAKCIYGQEEAARRRIEAALDGPNRSKENRNRHAHGGHCTA